MFCNFCVFAQECNIVLSGHVEDEDTKDKLVGAIVKLDKTNLHIITDYKGDFIFKNLCAGIYDLIITHINCDTIKKQLVINKDYHLDVIMPHARNTLSEVVLESQKGKSNTGFKKLITTKNLEETKGLSLAEALSKINGVTMLQTGSTIAKPVIHGMHGNRIITVNNGIRQEGQQWGNEHAPEIDPFIADKLIVIKGVDELKYGSDAIGGVILVETKPLRRTTGINAEINSAYFSNNRQQVVSAIVEQQFKNLPGFTYRLQGTLKKAANATTPSYRLNNTANQEKNFSLTLGWRKNKFESELFYSQFTNKVGIFTGSHIGNITDLQNAINSNKPDEVFTGENSFKIKRPNQDVAHKLLKFKASLQKNEHKFNIVLGAQFNNRKEFDIVRNPNNKNPQLDLSINTFTQEINWEQPKKNNFNAVAGLSFMQQQNSYNGRYFIPNYLAYSFGGFFIENWHSHKWDLQAGLRFDNKSINTTRLKFNSDTINFDFNFSTLASSFNATFKTNEQLKFNVNVGLASRAPYVNELLSDGIHHGTATYETGDIKLKTEKSFNFSSGFNYQNSPKNFQIDFLLYANLINDFIFQQPKPSTPVLTIAGAFPLIAYNQTNAFLGGLDVVTNYKITKHLEWQTKLAYLYARNTKLKDWLILMPANRINNEFTYNFKDVKTFSYSYISAEYAYVLKQKNTPSEINGKQDYKPAPNAYGLLHFNAATTLSVSKTKITIGIGIRNLLNTVYRDYLNSMRYFTDELGRNISVRLKIPLNN
jgi:iron complex outermembrane recepter protein